MACLLAPIATAFAGPQGGQVVAGQGDIGNPNPTTTLINQQSNRLVIDWNSFNVAPNETVQFIQPSVSAAALNRILGQDPSQILGNITANGQVYLLNPNGIVFSKTAVVNVGGLFATGLNISNDDFMDGNLKFTAPAGQDGGYIINHGVLHAADGGSINLIGSSVFNDGIIIANLGQVNMVGGSAVTVDFSGDGLMQFQVNGAVLHNMVDAESGAVVTNAGKVEAHGGTVVMTAAVAEQVLMQAVNNSGVVQANAIQNKNGHIYLTGIGENDNEQNVVASNKPIAGSNPNNTSTQAEDIQNQAGHIYLTGSGGDVVNSGVLDASGNTSNGGSVVMQSTDTSELQGNGVINVSSAASQGGTVEVLGSQVGLLDDSLINASGQTGGGYVMVGGDFHGANPNVQDATATYIGPNSTINADAIGLGNGGNVAVWSNDATQFYGSISARGGALRGNGGFVETSGKGMLDFQGIVDTRAPAGLAGTLLLDPTDITISNLVNTPTMTFGGGCGAGIYCDTTTTPSNLNVTILTTQLGLSNVTVSTASGLAGNGDITVNNQISYSSGFNLTLSANRNITITAGSGGITNTGTGALTLTGGGAGSIAINDNISTSGGAISLNSGSGGVTLANAKSINAGSGLITINVGGGPVNFGTGTLQTSNATASAIGVTNATALALGNVALTGGGTLILSFSGAGTQTAGTTISGTGGLTNSGTGTLTLSMANTYSGGSTILSGTLIGTLASAFGTGTITIGASSGSNNATLSGGGAVTFANAISVAAGNTGVATITDTAASTFSGAVTLNSNNLVLSPAASNLTLSGGVTGTGDLTLNATGAGIITLSGAAIDNTGTITNSGAGTATNTISAGVGANVTGITQNSTTSALTVSGLLTSNATATTLTNIAGTKLLTLSGGVANTAGNLILNNNSATAAGITLSGAAVNNIGTITNSGTGTGGSTISAVIGASVTGVVENSATSALTLSGANTFTSGATILSGTLIGTLASAFGTGTITIGASSGSNNATLSGGGAVTFANAISVAAGNTGVATITDTAASTFSGAVTLNSNNLVLSPAASNLTLSGGVTGTGDLTLNATGAGIITLSGAAIDNTGTITNSGAGTATNTISAGVGANVTGITQNSTTSALTVSGLLTSNATATTLTNIAGTKLLTLSGGVANTAGNLILNNNSATAAGITLSGAAVNNIGTITNSGTGTGGSTISAVIGASVTGVVENSATSALTLSGANTFTSGATILSGTLIGTLASAFGTGTITIGASSGSNNATLSGGGAVTFANAISVAAGNTGVATITDTAASTFSGAVTLNSNNLVLSPAASNLTLSGGVTGTGDLTLNATGAGIITLSGAAIDNTGTITNSGAGTATNTISAGVGANVTGITQNSTTSALTVSGLLTSNATATTLTNIAGTKLLTLSGGVANTAGNLILNNNSATAAGITLSGAAVNNIGTITNSGTGTGGSTISAVIGASVTGVVENSATSALTLSAANTYTSPTTISAGTLRIGIANAIGGSSAVTVASGAFFDLGGFSDAIGSLAGAGTVTSSGAATVTLTAGANNTSTIFSGVIQNGSGTVALTKNGAGTLTLSGVNTYNGPTIINAGTLQFAGSGSLWANDAVTLANVAGVTLDLNGTNQTIGSLAGGGAAGGVVTSSTAGAVTLTTGANNTSTTFSGVIQDGSGALALTQAGTGTFTLTGANTYSGITIISAGTLQIGNGGATGSLGSGNVTDSAALVFNLSSSPTVVNVISGTGTLTQAGTGTTTLTANNTFSGITTISAGTLQIGNGGATGSLGSGNVTDNAALIFNLSASPTIANVISGTGKLTQAGTGTTTLTANNTYSGITTISAGTLQIGNGGASGSLGSGNVTDNAALIFNLSSSPTVVNVISGTGTLTQAGTGTTTLTKSNTYTGATNINAGTLQTGIANAVGNSSALTVASGAFFDLGGFSDAIGSLAGAGTVTSSAAGAVTLMAGANNTSTTFAGVIENGSGTVALTKNGTGTLTLSAVNTYTGATTVTAGTLTDGIANAVPTLTNLTVTNPGVLDLAGFNQTVASVTGTGTVTDSGAATTFTVNNAGADTFAGKLAGALMLTKTAGGVLTLTGANTYTGATNINSGILSIQNSGALGTAANTSNTTVASGAELDMSGGITTTNQGTLILNGTGAGGGGALVNLSGNNTWNSTVLLGSNATIFSANASNTLTFSSTYTAAYTFTMGSNTVTIAGPGSTFFNSNVGVAGDTGGLVMNSTGTLTFYAYDTYYTGATTVNSGTLLLEVGPFTAGWYGINGPLTIGTGTGTAATVTIPSVAFASQISPNSAVTINSDGVLNVGSATSMGSLTLYGGQMNISAGVTATIVSNLTSNTNSADQTALISGGTLSLTSGNISVAHDPLLTSDLTISSVIAGTTLTKTGTGTLTLSGANTYTGLTTVSAGVIDVQNNTALGTLAGGTTVASGAAVQIDGSGLSIAEPITLVGTGVAGGGALLNLANNNTWSGAITLGAGGATIDSNGGLLTLTGGIVGGGNPLTFAGIGNITESGVISGAGTILAMNGSGTLTLSGANTYTGVTNINAGTLSLTNAGAIKATAGAVTVASGAALNINGVTLNTVAGGLLLQGTGVGGTGALTGTGVSGYAGPITLAADTTIGSTGALTLASISGASNALTLVGAGTQTFTGAVTAGTLNLNEAAGGNVTFSNNVTIGAGGISALANNFNIAFNGASNSVSGLATFSNTGVGSSVTLVSGGGSSTFTDGVNTDARPAMTFIGGTLVTSGTPVNLGATTLTGNTTLNSGAGNITFNGTLDGGFTLAANSSGTTTFGGIVGGVTPLTSITTDAPGSTAINGGLVTTTGAQTYNDNVSFGGPTTLITTNGNISVNGAVTATAGTLTFVAGTGNITMTTATNDFSTVTITSGGNVSLTDVNAIQFSGASVISGTLGVTAVGITEAVGGTLTVSGLSTLNAGAGVITLGNANNFIGAVSLNNSGANAVTLTNAGNLVLSTSNVGQNFTITAAGNISLVGALTVPGNASFTNSSGAADTILLDGQANNITGTTTANAPNPGGSITTFTLENTNAAAIFPTFSNVANLTVNFPNAPVILAPDFILTGSLVVIAGGAISLPGNVIIDGTSSFTTGAFPITLNEHGGQFVGAVSLTNSGANNVSLLTNGPLTLGTVSVGSGSLSLTGIGINEGASGTIMQAAGAGAVILNAGAGAIALGNANDFTGAVTLTNSGANNVSLSNGANLLTLGGATSIGTGTLTLNSLGITEDVGGTITQAAVAGAVTITAGAGVINLGNNNNFSGSVSLSNSGPNTTSLSNVGNLTLGTVNVGNSLVVSSTTGSLTLSGAITASGGNSTFNAATNMAANADITATGQTVALNIGTAGTGGNLIFGPISIGATTLNVAGGVGNDSFDLHNLTTTATTFTVNGGGGVNTLTGNNAGDNFNITGVNAGNITGLVTGFTNIQNLTGGTGDDSFVLAAGGSITNIDGGAGVNTLTGNNAGDNFNITGVNAGNITGLVTGFTNIQNLTGGTGDDSFTLASGVSTFNGSITGGGGVDTLAATDGSNAWAISGANAGTLNTTTVFSGISNLTGGTGDDDFVFSDGQGVTGTVDGGAGGTNTLDFSGYSTSVGITLTGSNPFGYSGTTSGVPNPTGGFADITQIDEPSFTNTLTLANGIPASVTINSSMAINLFNLTVTISGSPNLVFTNISTVNGGSGATNTLISGEGTNNIWTLTSANGGTYNDGQMLIFTNFGDLVGGVGNDDFVLAAGGSITNIDGGAGVNTLTGNNAGDNFNITGVNAGNITGLVTGFTNIQNLTGGTGDDSFVLAAGGSITNIDGGAGVNTLTGNNAGDNFNITGVNAGNITGLVTGFTNIQNLTGGTGDDSFVLAAGGSITNIDGGAGVNTLTGNNAGDNFNITGVNAGNITGLVTGFTNIQNLTGGTGDDSFTLASGVSTFNGSITGGGGVDTLAATDGSNAWAISGANAGTLNTTTVFSGISNLTGGTGDDDFVFSDGQGVTGTVDGGAGGTNTLDFSGYSTSVGITLTGSNPFGYSGTTSGVPNPTGGFADITQIDEPSFTNTLTLANGIPASVTINSSMAINLFNLTVTISGSPNLVFTNISTVNGGSGATNTLISGEGTNNIWTLTSANGGTYNDGQMLIFTNFGDLVGGVGNDDFVLAAGGSITNIDGGAGVNTLTGNNAGDNFNITGVNAGNITGLVTGFTNIQNLTGGTGDDSFVLAAGGSITNIDGGAGVNTLTGNNAGDNFNITGVNAGNITGLVTGFTNIQNLTGGNGNDSFAFVTGGSVSGTLDGGAGINGLDYSGFNAVVSVNLSTASATAINGGAANGISNIEALTGNGVNTTLTGPGGTNNWDITGLDAGDINGPGSFSFAQVWNLTGGGVQDTYIFSDGQGIQGTLTGGVDGILDYDLYTTAVTVNLGNNTATGTGGISGISGLIGTSIGSNLTTLIAGNGSNTWHITGANAGDLNGPGTFSFTQVQNLTGGTGDDDFVFSDGQGVTGTVDGGAGGTNTLDFSGYSTSVGITLTGSNPFGYSGTTSGVPNPTGGFADITQIDEPSFTNTLTLANGIPASVTINSSMAINLFNLTVTISGSPNLVFTNISTVNGGSGATNTLISGEGTNNIWTLTSANGGTYNDGQMLIFTNFGDLVGGVGNDDFVLAAGGSITNIDGGAGVNTLTGNNAGDNFNITGVNAGNITGLVTGFTNIQNLTGGTGDDSFVLAAGGSITNIDGGAGVNTLTGNNAGDNFNITGVNAGNITGLVTGFTNIQNLTGGTGDDSFVLAAGGSITNIDGGAGVNTLTGNNAGDNFNITGVNAGNITGLVTGFTNIQNLTGGTGDDSFTLASGVSTFNGSITGGGGVDTLAATDGSNAWAISGANAGTLNTTTVFSGISNLTGGTGDDDFVFSDGQGVTGTVDGGAGGTNTLDFSGYSTSVGITLTGSNPFGYSGTTSGVPNPTGGFADITQIDEPSFTNTLTLANGIPASVTINSSMAINLFNLTVTISGSPNLVFTNISTVNGGSGATNTLISGEGTNNIWTLTSANGGTYNDGQMLIFTNFGDLVGGVGNDDFVLAAGGSITNIDGGAGVNTLTGNNAGDNFNITGVNAGNITGLVTGFTNIQNLTGGTGDDSFVLAAGGSITNIDGGAGVNTLTGNNAGDNFNITGVNAGNITGLVTGFTNIQNLTGGTGDDSFVLAAGGSITNIDGGAGVNTLTGNNAGDNFNITGVNAGNITGLVTGFTNIQNLTGGTGDDSFTFVAGGSVGGNLTGGGGTDTLDYSGLAGPVNVVLTSVSGGLGTGTGSLIAGNFSGMSILKGSAGATDILSGPNQPNVWQITNADAGNVDGFQFLSIENLTGGGNTNQFVLNGGSLTGQIIGGSGSAAGNSLQGNNGTNIWDITGANQGTVIGIGGGFTNVGNLVGGNGTDTFILSNGASLAGELDGGGVSSGNDTIDWSAYLTARNVILTGPGSIDGMQGTETSIAGGFDNITNIIGANGVAGLLSTLTGPNTANIWNVTSSNGGNLDSALNFSNFQILTGGSNVDTFNLSAGVSGSINGGTGDDTVNVVNSFTAPAPTLTINNVETINDNAAATINATTLSISGATSIGSAGTPLLTNISALQISGSNGNAFINNFSNVDLQGIAVGSGTFSLVSDGSVTDLTDQGVTAGSVIIDAATGIGTSGAPIKTVTGNLSAAVNGIGDIYFSNTGTVTLGSISTSDGDINITSSGGMIAGGSETTGGNGNIDLSTSNGNLTTTGNIAANGTGSVNIDAAGNLNLDSTISSSSGTLSLTGGTGVTGNSNGSLTGSIVDVTAASGDIFLIDVTSSATGGTTLLAPGNVTLQGFTTTDGELTIMNGGTFAVTAAVSLGGSLDQMGAGPVSLGSSITSSGGDVQFASGVTVNGSADITTHGGNIIFNQGMTGTGGSAYMTLDSGAGNIDLQAVANLGTLSLTTSGALLLNDDVNSSSLLATSVTGGVVIDGQNVHINTTNSDLDFSSATGINGITAGGQALTINTGSGSVNLAPVGQTTPLSSLSINGGTVTLANVTTDNAQSYTGNVQLHGNLSSTVGGGVQINGNLSLLSNAAIGAADGGNILVSGNLDGAHALTLAALSGQVTLNGAVGGVTALTSLTVNSIGANLKSVMTSGNQTYQTGTANLAGVLNSKAGAISFSGVLKIAATSTIQADAIGFNGGASSVRGNNTLTLLPETNGLTVNLGGSGSGLTLNNTAMNGYDGSLYIGTGPGPGSPLYITNPVAVLAGNVTINGSLTFGSSGTLLLAGLGNLTLNSGTLTANSITLIAGSQNSLMLNPGTTQTLIQANSVILVSGGRIGNYGQELNIATIGSNPQVQIATGAIQVFLSPPNLPTVIGPAAFIANDIAAQLGLFIQANSQVTSIGQQIAALSEDGGLLESGFVDISLFQNISLYNVYGLGISLPVDQCERLNNQSCNQ